MFKTSTVHRQPEETSGLQSWTAFSDLLSVTWDSHPELFYTFSVIGWFVSYIGVLKTSTVHRQPEETSGLQSLTAFRDLLSVT